VILQKQGRVAEGIAEFRQALAQRPLFAGAHSNLLMAMHYVETDARQIYHEHVKWGRLHGNLAKSARHRNEPVVNKRLRVGLVSPDFREHSVAFFLEPLVAKHDREQIELICYSGVARPDAVTERFRRYADGWREIRGETDEQVAALIENEQVDVLIDLAGHTSGNRLLVFARKPALVQVSWLGYPDTTGLSAMDWRMTDAIADPPGAEAFYTEQLMRLGRAAWCYRPGAFPDVGAARGGVTFGSFHTLEKITPRWLGIWCEILAAAPGARLIVKARGLGDKGTMKRFEEAFAERGMRERLELMPATPTLEEHLRLYGGVDVALDTFPYHGTTTTCEAMWMGVPVVTMRGTTHASRVGASLLSAMGLDELVTGSSEEYVRVAVELAKDEPRRHELRRTLRERMVYSPLMDEERFAREFERALREMWRTWCAGRGR
jgi:predicted O-linked N-acetylglucosamine transferase (SPINDLY family)